MRLAGSGRLIVITVLVVVLGGYSAFWFVVAGQIENGIGEWAESLRPHDVDLSWRSIRVGGFTAIVDATFLSKGQRQRLRSLAIELHVSFAIAHAEASEATLEQRIVRRAASELDASEATVDVLAHQLKSPEPLDANERAEVFVFDTEHDDDHAQATKAAQMLQRLRAVDSSKM